MVHDPWLRNTALEEFWKKLHSKQAVTDICESWEEVTDSCMTVVLQNLLSECANDFGGFITPINEVIDIAIIGRDLSFEDVDLENEN